MGGWEEIRAQVFMHACREYYNVAHTCIANAERDNIQYSISITYAQEKRHHTQVLALPDKHPICLDSMFILAPAQ